MRTAAWLAPFALALALPSPALADEPAAKVGDIDISNADKDKKPDGFFPFIYLDAQISMTDNRGWVGQPEGTTATFGYKLETGFDLRHKKSELELDFLASQALTKTPVVDELLRGRDILDLAAIYQYRAIKWVGPYIRAQATSQLLKGTDVRPGDTLYRITRIGGVVQDVVRPRLFMTEPFQPFQVREAVGVFLEPVERPEIDLDLRLGAAGRHTFADGQLALSDDAATADVVEITELQTVHQIGLELATVAEGKFAKDVVGYKVKGEVMMPLFTSPEIPKDAANPGGDKKGPIDLLNFDVSVALKFKLAAFASLDYELKLVRNAAVLDLVQVQNNLLLSLGVKAGREKPK